MAQGRSRHQRGRVVSIEGGGWEIHYNVYLTDPATGKPKRHHRSRVVGHAPKMSKAEAETILAAELAAEARGRTRACSRDRNRDGSQSIVPKNRKCDAPSNF